jgi:hypothetical protein
VTRNDLIIGLRDELLKEFPQVADRLTCKLVNSMDIGFILVQGEGECSAIIYDPRPHHSHRICVAHDESRASHFNDGMVDHDSVLHYFDLAHPKCFEQVIEEVRPVLIRAGL